MRKFYFSLLVGLLTAVTSRADVAVTSSDDGMSVTIAVTGDAGQIGTTITQYGNSSYSFTEAISEENRNKITSATTITITGKICAADIQALTYQCNEAKNNSPVTEKLDMSGAEIEKITCEDNSTKWDFDATGWYKGFPSLKTLLLPKVTGTDGTLAKSTSYFCPFGMWCKNVESVVIGEGITAIGENCFSGCSKLSSVKFPAGLKTIGKKSFAQCNFKAIYFPNTLEEVGEEAFYNPTGGNSIETLVFPASLKKIGKNAFQLNRVKDVYFLGEKCPEVDDEAFDTQSYNGNNGYSVNNGTANTEGVERNDYGNGEYPIAILHLNPNLTEAEKKKFTDITRIYSYKDKYVGEQKMWPTHDEMSDSYNTACNGTLIDGTTSYGKYKGLHKFVLVSYDATAPTSDEWDFSKYSSDLWWTIMVPFDMTKSDVKEVFGDGTEVCKFSAVERDVKNKKITLEFKDEQCQVESKADDDVVIEAFHSYMIHPHGEGTFKFAYQTEVENVVATEVTASDGAKYDFIGNHYSQTERATKICAPQYCYGLGVKSDGSHHALFFHGTANRTWSQWTAIVRQSVNGTDYGDFFSSNSKLSSAFGTDGTSAIETVEVEAGANNNSTADNRIYSISGTLMSNGNANALPKGLYIKNGKKFIIK